MEDFDAIIGWAEVISRRVAEVAAIKRLRRLERRRALYQLNKPYAAKKRADRVEKKKQELESEKWREQQVADSCTCWMGHPPCHWCTDISDPDGLRDE